MHRSTLPKLLALFISGSILFSSVPVYARETTSFTESVTEEASAEPDDTADNSDEDVNIFLADEDIAGESLTDTVDENRETPVGPDSGSATIEGSNISDSQTAGNKANVEESRVGSDSKTTDNEANVENGCVDSASETTVGDADIPGKNDTNSDDADTSGNNDTNTDDSETYDEQNSSFNTIVKKESFAHLYYDDVNDPAYD